MSFRFKEGKPHNGVTWGLFRGQGKKKYNRNAQARCGRGVWAKGGGDRAKVSKSELNI